MTLRRLKTYTGSQGYVYQYYFVGKRPALVSESDARQSRVLPSGALPSGVLPSEAHEYIFDVTSDRKLTYAVSIFLPQRVVAAWGESHGRALGDSEQYAAVKMRLFRAFDELEDMQATGRRLQIDEQSLEDALASLGVE